MPRDSIRNPLDLDQLKIEPPRQRWPWPKALRLIMLLVTLVWLLIGAVILGITHS